MLNTSNLNNTSHQSSGIYNTYAPVLSNSISNGWSSGLSAGLGNSLFGSLYGLGNNSAYGSNGSLGSSNNMMLTLLTLVLQLLQQTLEDGGTQNNDQHTPVTVDQNAFNQHAGADGLLQGSELQALASRHAGADGSFNQSEFSAFAQSMGISPATAARIFNGNAVNGQMPTSVITNNLAANSTLDLNGFTQFLNSLNQSSAPAPAPVPAPAPAPVFSVPAETGTTVQTGNG
ncbi:MAG: hypothetical protein KDI15_11890, partial [Thiothrix sp.]|nr:hypothetical protein [Thiothrix sp.]